jgi:hypothetical protein
MTTRNRELYYYQFRNSKADALFTYPLAIPRGVKQISNEFLFDLLFKFLYGNLPALMAGNRFISAYNCLSYHHLFCNLPRFEFVKFAHERYDNRIVDEGIPTARESIHQDVLRWFEDHECNSAIYEWTLRNGKKIIAPDPEEPDVPPGSWISRVPEPQNDLEAFQRLKFLTAQQTCEYMIKDFNRRYVNADQRIYQAELDDINNFIESTTTIDLRKALSRIDMDERNEYLRIMHQYYSNHRCEYVLGGIGSRVYGRYIWYKVWLEKKVRQLIETPKPLTLPALEPRYTGSVLGMQRETFELLTRRGILSTFFMVKGTPLEGGFWYDINDQETSDAGKVVRISRDSYRRKRDATKNDFSELFEEYNIIGKTWGKAFKYFLDDFIEHVRLMMESYRKLHKPEEKKLEHYELLELADDFIDWLKAKQHMAAIGSTVALNVMQPSTQQKLKMKVIAMFYFYKGVRITRANGDYIAKLYEYTSGEKLYAHYTDFSSSSNRTRSTGSSKSDRFRLAEYEQTIELLLDLPEARSKAEADRDRFLKVTMD